MLKPLAVSRGGPVIMVQVENEFGNFGVPDSGYLDAMQAALRGGGWDGVVFSADPPGVQSGGRPGMLRAANFGRNAEKMIMGQREAFPGQPDFCAEFWVGWFDTWGRPRSGGMHHRLTGDLGWMMRNGVSFNLYMFHGGSTRGLRNGANGGKHYLPTTCCYDFNYGSFLNEERKGLSSPVSLAGRELGPFEHVCLPMQEPPLAKSVEAADDPPKGALTIRRSKLKIGSPRDTWLDMRGFERGIVWFNGRNLGRYWSEGPPRSIFLPACWMKADEENELVVLELEARNSPDNVPTSDKAIWGNSR